MPNLPRKKNSDYLRFRPYRAFTSQPAQSDGWSIFWKVVIVAAAIVVVLIAAHTFVRR
jgi:anti-sigma-K factor RskA